MNSGYERGQTGFMFVLGLNLLEHFPMVFHAKDHSLCLIYSHWSPGHLEADCINSAQIDHGDLIPKKYHQSVL